MFLSTQYSLLYIYFYIINVFEYVSFIREKYWTLIAEASGCVSSARTEIAVASNLNLFNHATIWSCFKLSKHEIINLALDYQSKFDSTWAGIKNKLFDLKKDFEKLGSDLSVTRQVNFVLRERVTSL